jgi:beta-lactamase class A
VRLLVLPAAIVLLLAFAGDAGPSPAQSGQTVELGVEASGERRPAAFPDRSRIRATRRYAGRHAGRVSFAVIDTRRRLRGLRLRRPYASASTTKTMLAIAYLRKLVREG